jgi:hypothetical protein
MREQEKHKDRLEEEEEEEDGEIQFRRIDLNPSAQLSLSPICVSLI